MEQVNWWLKKWKTLNQFKVNLVNLVSKLKKKVKTTEWNILFQKDLHKFSNLIKVNPIKFSIIISELENNYDYIYIYIYI